MTEGLSSKCVAVVCGNTIQDGWLAASGEKYSLRVFSACIGGTLTRDHLWNCFKIPFPIMKAKCGSHLNCFPNITKPCTCNLTKLKPMLCLNSSSCARSINLLASVSSASLPHACMSNCF
ncbi:hypothetical protein CICLE_v10029944mg [Citrus x clementina]|uniref:Uncharacterized protein n=1 Tax=Citrus clementina TaxID=85681 RepID=V4UBP3_CITCL|nr:hypothetical protein CICLE_v10029944mg [Citrus x clementina]